MTLEGTRLALDLGTDTGWALRRDGTTISGTASFKVGRYEGGGMRYLRFQRWLDELARDGVDSIWFEEVRRHAGTDAAHVYGGLLATLTAWCEHHGIPYSGIPVGTWKKSLCGKGNASKEMVLDAIKARGFSPSGFDESDAIGVLLAVESGGI